MFAKIRKGLTLRYTLVMMLLMMAFIIVSSAGLLWILYREEQQDLQSFTEAEARQQAAIYKERAGFFQFTPKEGEHAEIGTKIFYYVFDTNGRQAAVEEPVNEIRAGVLNIIHKWDAPEGEAELKKFRLLNGDRAVVMLCSRQIYDETKMIGTVFVGEDISSYYHMLKMLLIMMVLISIVFLVIAAFAGHLLAGKAMIPIKQAFLRQREFVADASHELRTPLSILLTSVDAVQTDDELKLTSFSSQVLADMKTEIHRMTKLVTDLLTLARADAGTANLIKEEFNLVALAEQLVRSVRPLAEQKGVHLTLESDAEIFVVADQARISQLLLILVDNAIKYTPAGGRIRISLAVIAAQKPYAAIAVHDTGMGIAEAQCKSIFERFYRADKARSRSEGDVGLGLAIAQWIISAHEGKIKVESVPGEGSTFTVTLPL